MRRFTATRGDDHVLKNLNFQASHSSGCSRARLCFGVMFLQGRVEHQSSARLPGVARVHRPEPGPGSQAVPLELQAAGRGSEDRPHDGGVRPAVLSLQRRRVSEHWYTKPV